MKKLFKIIINYIKFESLDKNNENYSEKNREIIKNNRTKLFIYFIGIPITICAIYFYGVGRKKFFTRSDVVVRSSTNGISDLNLSSLLRPSNSGSIEDARFLRTYLESPQILNKLRNQINFIQLFEKKGLDLFSGIKKNASEELIFKFFRKQVSISLDETSGILIIRTLAFDPRTSLFLNEFLIKESEIFVNNLNQEIYRKQLGFVENQVLKKFSNLNKTQKELESFQVQNNLLDAEREAILDGSIIKGLEEVLLKLKVDLSTIKRKFVDKTAPEIVDLENQIEEIEKQIEEEKRDLLSPEGKDFSKKISDMRELKKSVDFASELYKASLLALEKTRIESIQQQKFMATISNPQLPDSQWMNWRHKGFLTFLSGILISFFIVKFLIAMTESHND